MRGLSALAILAVLLLFADQPARAAAPFADWSVIIVAGDDHAHSGAHSEVFDNARRDLAHGEGLSLRALDVPDVTLRRRIGCILLRNRYVPPAVARVTTLLRNCADTLETGG